MVIKLGLSERLGEKKKKNMGEKNDLLNRVRCNKGKNEQCKLSRNIGPGSQKVIREI